MVFFLLIARVTAGLGSGNALFFTVTDSETENLVVNFDTVTLGYANEMIRLQFDVRLNETFGSDTIFCNAFRFGLYDAGTTILQSDVPDTSLTEDDVGYFLTLACGDSLPQAILLADRGESTVNGGSDTQTLTTLSVGRLNNQQNHTLLFVITRAEGNQMRWDFYIDGIAIIDGYTSTPAVAYGAFNEIVFTSAAGIDFVLDNVEVLTNAGSGMFFEECLSTFSADLNLDCHVDLNDAALLGGHWLNTYHLVELLQLAEDWLRCANLNLVNCY